MVYAEYIDPTLDMERSINLSSLKKEKKDLASQLAIWSTNSVC